MDLGLIKFTQIAGILPRHRLLHHAALLQQNGQRIGQHLFLRNAQQGPGSHQQLPLRQKCVSIIQIVAQGKQHPRGKALGVVIGKSEGQGQRVRPTEVHCQLPLGKKIGVLLHRLPGPVSKPAVQRHSQLGRQVVGRQKIQQPPHPHLKAKCLSHGLGPFGGQTLDLGEPLWLMLQHRKGLLPKKVEHFPCRRDTDAPDHAGGQIVKDGLLPRGHPPAGHLGLKLLAIGGMMGPSSLGGKALPRSHARDAPHHGDRLLLPNVQERYTRSPHSGRPPNPRCPLNLSSPSVPVISPHFFFHFYICRSPFPQGPDFPTILFYFCRSPSTCWGSNRFTV